MTHFLPEENLSYDVQRYHTRMRHVAYIFSRVTHEMSNATPNCVMSHMCLGLQEMANHTEQGASDVPEAGVGMTLTERHPFSVVSLRPGGAAAMDATIRVGDEVSLSLSLFGSRSHARALFLCTCV